MKRLSIWAKLYLGMVAFSLAGSLMSAMTGVDSGPVKPVASLLVIAFGFIALARVARWGLALLVLLVGTGAEVLGVYSGYPFGQYTYTARWWPTIQLSGGYSFPILVPFAWFLVAGGCALALKPIGKSSLVFAPMVATLIDFFMEPVMVRTLGYWRWLDPGPLPGGAPWLNVAGWFGTSFLATWVLSQYKSAQSDDPPWIVIGFVLLVAGLWLIPGKLAT